MLLGIILSITAVIALTIIVMTIAWTRLSALESRNEESCNKDIIWRNITKDK